MSACTATKLFLLGFFMILGGGLLTMVHATFTVALGIVIILAGLFLMIAVRIISES